jgi:intein-encoded DNA endonuclease-like protein
VYSVHHVDLAKNYLEPVPTDYTAPQPKDFIESPDYMARRTKAEDYYANYTVQELNLELDKNCKQLLMQLIR